MRDERYVSYELIRRSEERIGLKSGWLRTVIPYSVSMPITFGMAMTPPCGRAVRAASSTSAARSEGARCGVAKGRRRSQTAAAPWWLQVLTGVDDPLDGALLLLRLAHQRLDIHD